MNLLYREVIDIKEELISVIVPVYNVEKYLSRCIDSIINQTYKNLEIILIDDGSTDGSSAICEKYKDIDKRVKVVHKQNGGLSDARNTGMKIAKGDLITFVDSDDSLIYNIYDNIVKKMQKDCVDIACFGYKRINEDNDIMQEVKFKEDKVYEDNTKFELLYQGYYYSFACVAWNKIYKKEIFKDIMFPIGKYNEDEYIVHEIFYKANKIGIYSDEGYLYRQRKNSITQTYNIKRLDVIQALKNRLEFIDKKNLSSEFYQQTLNIFLYSIIQHYRKIEACYLENDKNEIQKSLIKDFQKYYCKLNLKSIRIQNKIKYIAFDTSPKISSALLNRFFKI